MCERWRVPFTPAAFELKVGISKNVRDGAMPLNGLRHPAVGDTSGWYIWGGEAFSDAPDFFVPLHIEHLHEWCLQVLPYLALPPGWRFLIAQGHEEVWEDRAPRREVIGVFGTGIATKSSVCSSADTCSPPRIRSCWSSTTTTATGSFLCGDEHAENDIPNVVGLPHLLERDPSLNELQNLTVGSMAQRTALGRGWTRSTIDE